MSILGSQTHFPFLYEIAGLSYFFRGFHWRIWSCVFGVFICVFVLYSSTFPGPGFQPWPIKLDEDYFMISHDLCVSSCTKHISYNFMNVFLSIYSYIYISLGGGGWLVSRVRSVTVLVRWRRGITRWQTGLAAFTLSGSCILNPWFLGSFSFICSHLLFIYFLPFSRISVCLSAFGVSSVRDRHRVVGASVFPYSLCLVLFTLCCSFVTTHFMFFFFSFFSFHRSFSEKREKRKKKEKGRCSGDWGSLRHGVWKVLLYNIMLLFLSLFVVFRIFISCY
ncbi:hypothetical protein HOY82DRAFT_175280 [Tuber indicum]|nr:hypothetical protein HOY82DRAFT_175280 [Tuber indicum]